MGALLAYTIYSGIFLLFLFLFYKLLVSGEKQIVLNRVLLLLCYAVSFAAWPISRIDWHVAKQESTHVPLMAIDNLSLQTLAIGEHSESIIPQMLIWVYIFGAVAVLASSLYSILRIMIFIRQGEIVRNKGYKIFLMPDANITPFSIGNYIVMSAKDYETVGDTVTAHELAHIKCMHYVDLIIAQIVCVMVWYNPASWLMRDELKLLHEYQADAKVIDRGVDIFTYQMLLIKRTVGNRFNTLSNSLNHSKLKDRIAMMQKENCSGVRRMRVIALAIAPIVSFGLMNIPTVASDLKTLEAASLHIDNKSEMISADIPVIAESISLEVAEAATSTGDSQAGIDDDDSKAVIDDRIMEEKKELKDYPLQDPEIPAEFPGGIEKLMQYLSMNIRYPQAAHVEDRTGKSVVGFTIQADGAISDVRILESAWPDLDAEAVRVVKSMPKWQPATTGGIPVASQFSIPINFRLQSMNESEGMPPIKKEETYIKLSENGSAKLVVGPSEEKECDVGDTQAFRVDGKLLTESMTIDMSDIESYKVFPPSEEFPGGLCDIKLKKK